MSTRRRRCVPMEVYPLRIPPGGEITSLLQKTVHDLDLKAAFIVSCVGSVKSVILRFATDTDGSLGVSDRHENLEICSLVGTLSKDGYHLHGTFGNSKGGTVSGHVMGNMVVQTTAEIVIGNAGGFEFRRLFDEETGFKELVVKEPNRDDDSDSGSSEFDITPKNRSVVFNSIASSEDSDKENNSSTSSKDGDKDKNSDEPPVKKAKTKEAFPTDEAIEAYVTEVINGANLEEVTMKTVCKTVYENFPDHDLTHKKELIKETVRKLITIK